MTMSHNICVVSVNLQDDKCLVCSGVVQCGTPKQHQQQHRDMVRNK